MRFVKGHGTRNDFVVLPDLDDRLHLTDDDVRALCDRRGGIGADGILRVVRAATDGAADAPWFMDYRNADGSVAEMCGNGIRVFGRFLVDEGLAEPGRILVDTRAGVKKLDVPATGDVTVGMGAPERLADAKVGLGGQWWPAAGWSMGNPHLVLIDGPSVDEVDLSEPPQIDPATAYPDGVNVEVVEIVADEHIRMRVHERGVGETQSCGTGACAAAVAVMAVRGGRGSYAVDVPGGRLQVKWCDGGQVLLTGPAEIVATGEYHRDSPA